MTITIQSSPYSVSKLIAFIIVSILGGLCLQLINHSILQEINSMTADQYVAQDKSTYQQSIGVQILVVALMGALYLGMIELIAFLIRLALPRRAATSDTKG